MASQDQRAPHTLQTVDRALSFLEYVSTSVDPPSVKQVAEALDLNLATSYHLLRTLLARGYLERGDDGGLRLGGAVGTLAHAYRTGLDVHEDLAHLVEEINRETNETAFLSTLDGRSVILKELVEGTQPLRVGGLSVGYAGNELRRASGKIVLAYLPDEPREEIVSRNLQSMPADERERARSKLTNQLAEARANGWAVDHQDSEAGVTGIAAPIFNARDHIFGAIGLVAPTSRAATSTGRLVDVVVAAAADATRLLHEASLR